MALDPINYAHDKRSLSRKMSHFLSYFLFEIYLLFRWFTWVQIDGFLRLPVAGRP